MLIRLIECSYCHSPFVLVRLSLTSVVFRCLSDLPVVLSADADSLLWPQATGRPDASRPGGSRAGHRGRARRWPGAGLGAGAARSGHGLRRRRRTTLPPGDPGAAAAARRRVPPRVGEDVPTLLIPPAWAARASQTRRRRFCCGWPRLWHALLNSGGAAATNRLGVRPSRLLQQLGQYGHTTGAHPSRRE